MKKNFKSLVFLMMIAFSFVLTACNDQPVILDSLQNEYGVVIEGGKFEEGSTLVTNSVTTTSDEGKKVLEILSAQDYNKEGNIYIFDIYVSKDDKKIQPDGKVKVTIPITEIDSDNYFVFHIKENNSVEKLIPTLLEGQISFETSSFSYFAIVEEAIKEHVHNYELVEGVDPSCIKEGTVEHYHCDECGKNFDMNYGEIEDLTIEKSDHEYIFVEEIPATCKEEGTIKHYHCDVCGKNFDMNYGEIEDLTIEKSDHEYGSMYWGKSPSFWEDGNIEYYFCEECEKYFDVDYTEVESVVLPKLSRNISICVNGVATPLEIVEENESQIIWTLDNLDVTKGDAITICETDNPSVTYNYYAEGNVNKDGIILTTAENVSVQAMATPNGIMLFIDGYKYEGIVIEINGEQYPMAIVTYEDGTPTYIYGYVYLNQGDEFVIIDNENDTTYDYDDLDEHYLWDKWDFHRGDDGEFVIDYTARYGIEFDDDGNKKIYVDKIFAPAEGNSFEVVFEDETMDPVPLAEMNIPSNDGIYKEYLWEINHEEVTNKDDIVSYIEEHGLYIYTDTIYLEAGTKFNIKNITKDSIIGFDRLTDVYTSSENFTKDGDYIKILTSGYYMISYMPCFDSFMIEDSYVEETADLFMYLDGEYVPLTINEDNTVTYEELVADTSTNISFISNNYMNYYPITIDSNTDSSIAYVYESSGISLVFFNKAGTYDLTYNVETGVLTIIDQNPEEPGDSSVEYMYFLSVVNSSSDNQTLYFTRTPDENKEVVIKDATLDANCYIAVGGVAVDGSGSTENYGALSDTDSSIAVSYGTFILVKQSGKYDVYFNTETKTARLVLVGEIEVAPSVPKDIYIRYDNILTLEENPDNENELCYLGITVEAWDEFKVRDEDRTYLSDITIAESPKGVVTNGTTITFQVGMTFNFYINKTTHEVRIVIVE